MTNWEIDPKARAKLAAKGLLADFLACVAFGMITAFLLYWSR